MNKEQTKKDFRLKLSEFVKTLKSQVSTNSDEWTIKGFIDYAF